MQGEYLCLNVQEQEVRVTWFVVPVPTESVGGRATWRKEGILVGPHIRYVPKLRLFSVRSNVRNMKCSYSAYPCMHFLLSMDSNSYV